VHVVEAIDAVVGWHRDHLLPDAALLTDDPRCHLVTGDFFALVAAGAGFGPGVPDRVHAVLVDIDHSPRHLLDAGHAPFYAAAGLRRLTDRLHPGGVFALWADGAPDPDFVAVLDEVFTVATAHEVSFPNFYTGATSASTVYVAA
jgi:spermidine synthase